MIYYDDRLFQTVSTENHGDVDADTVFRYEQREAILMGTYSGGNVDFGSLVGKVRADGTLSFLYHHITKSGVMKSGKCESRPEILPSGKIRLHERWTWLSGSRAGEKGTSVIEEL